MNRQNEDERSGFARREREKVNEEGERFSPGSPLEKYQILSTSVETP